MLVYESNMYINVITKQQQILAISIKMDLSGQMLNLRNTGNT